jgi:hypothetical protein
MIKSKLLAVVILTLAIFVGWEVQAASSIVVDFTYPTKAASYNLYMDNVKVCNAPQGTTNQITCSGATVVVPYGTHNFTMTAMNASGVESNKSPVYPWTYSPDVTVAPVVVTLTVTVDGKVVTAKPVTLVQKKATQPAPLAAKQMKKAAVLKEIKETNEK